MTVRRIEITDVSVRDGLQNQAVTVSTNDKIELIRLLVRAGVRSVEVGSFVSPKAVPQMADSADVVKGAISVGLQRPSALVPNRKGLERALASGTPEVAVVLSATETMNLRNINMGLRDAAAVATDTLRAARSAGLKTRAYLAVAFECPFEGMVDADIVRSLAQEMLEAGAQELVIADTIGAAAPTQVDNLLALLVERMPVDLLAMHFHDTRGFGVANAYAALKAGVRKFDASAGGIGGCPFAPGAAGNLATEDLVLLAQQSGIETGIDLENLMDAVAFSERVLERPVGGRCSTWLRRQLEKRRASDIREAIQ